MYDQLQTLIESLPDKAWDDPEFAVFIALLCDMHADQAWKKAFSSCSLVEDLNVKGGDGTV